VSNRISPEIGIHTSAEAWRQSLYSIEQVDYNNWNGRTYTFDLGWCSRSDFTASSARGENRLRRRSPPKSSHF